MGVCSITYIMSAGCAQVACWSGVCMCVCVCGSVYIQCGQMVGICSVCNPMQAGKYSLWLISTGLGVELTALSSTLAHCPSPSAPLLYSSFLCSSSPPPFLPPLLFLSSSSPPPPPLLSSSSPSYPPPPPPLFLTNGCTAMSLCPLADH